MYLPTLVISCITLILSIPYSLSITIDKTSALVASETLIRRYSTQGADNAGLTPEEFSVFLTKMTSHSPEFIDKLVGDCKRPDKNCSWKEECPGVHEIFDNLASDGLLKSDGFFDALPFALNTLSSENCTRGALEETYHGKHKRKPSAKETWGYSIGFVTLIIFISNIGACLGPIMEKRFFKRLLQFLIAMGAGSLASTSLLVLIPEAFGIIEIEEIGHAYVWKASVVIISIYILFSLERLFKTVLYNRKTGKIGYSASASTMDSVAPLTDIRINGHLGNNQDAGHSHFHLSTEQSNDKVTLAWMVMAGDVIHNFVDGLSMGAAFSEDVGLGISISLAIISEELPHELADIAILLHSGMSIKRSLFINFLSACVCYIGLVIGILLGTTLTEASKWIFAMAGGLFLYVPLVDMLPDMSEHLDILLQRGGPEAKIVAGLHTIGLLMGAGIIIFIVNINSYIDVN
ncbi:metal cation symporter ZIP14-like [Physella acuta]|uniref:metal cation symporter ZIP14-like n=1 Tax=Physella acuta TaxID=109671 RepID=UPI0027DD6D39|nr:metal cation symporter ZIP14-like [Physella acuta]